MNLRPYRCANDHCPSQAKGEGQIVMRGLDNPGWVGEGYCHQCHCYTLVEVTVDGQRVEVRGRRSLLAVSR